MPSINVLSIDAWRQAEGGWTWNAWHRVGEADRSVCNLSPRRLLSFARKEGSSRLAVWAGVRSKTTSTTSLSSTGTHGSL